MYGGFYQAAKKSGLNNEATVLPSWPYKVGFYYAPWFFYIFVFILHDFGLFVARLIYIWGNDIPLPNSNADPPLPLRV